MDESVLDADDSRVELADVLLPDEQKRLITEALLWSDEAIAHRVKVLTDTDALLERLETA